MHSSRHIYGPDASWKTLLLTLACLAACCSGTALADTNVQKPEVDTQHLKDNHKQPIYDQALSGDRSPVLDPAHSRNGARQSRQYDSQMSGASSMASYATENGLYGDQMTSGQQMGYTPAASHLSTNQHSFPHAFGPDSFMPPGPPSGSLFPMSGPKAFDLTDMLCTGIAVAIGAVIVGAPLILIYLFIMNQVNGSNTNGGSISLTGPTSSTTVNGRKKRNSSIPELLFKQLSPLVNSQQVANTFKLFLDSMAKYQA